MNCAASESEISPSRRAELLWQRSIVAGLLALQACLLAWQAWRMSPTLDEPAHLAAGISHWTFGRFDLYRVNPPLVRMVAALPMLLIEPKTNWDAFTEAPYGRPEFSIGTAFANANGFDTFWHFTLARWACIPFSLIGGYVCYRWSRELYGGAAGVLAAALWCFSPNILGNGALLTPDLGAAALGVTAGYTFWRWLRAPAWTTALLAGIALGLAQLTKSAWIILFCLWPALWVAITFRTAAARDRVKTGVQLVLILLLAVYCLNLGYGFEKTFNRLGSFRFISHTLGGPEAHTTPGNRFAESWLGRLPVPVPANYLAGIDVQKYDFERKKWSYLRGQQRFGGWWYYYLYALAVKVPLGTLLLVVVTCGMRAARSRMPPKVGSPGSPASPFPDTLTVLAPAIVLLFLVSSQTGFNRYLRYVLPCFPFFFVWVSQLASAFDRRTDVLDRRIRTAAPTAHAALGGRRSRGQTCVRAVVALSLTASVLSSLAAVPHSLSYFNELAGGPRQGHRHLLDANLDWGQDLLELKRWTHAHPQARPLHVAYFGFISPATANIASQPIPQTNADLHNLPNPEARSNVQAGWYAISVNELYGYNHFGERQDEFAWLRTFRPSALAGYSIRIIRVDPEDMTPASNTN